MSGGRGRSMVLPAWAVRDKSLHSTEFEPQRRDDAGERNRYRPERRGRDGRYRSQRSEGRLGLEHRRGADYGDEYCQGEFRRSRGREPSRFERQREHQPNARENILNPLWDQISDGPSDNEVHSDSSDGRKSKRRSERKRAKDKKKSRDSKQKEKSKEPRRDEIQMEIESSKGSEVERVESKVSKDLPEKDRTVNASNAATEESDDDVGPMPLQSTGPETGTIERKSHSGEKGPNYGQALLPSEGAAIAAFVQKNVRIPRRGEIGLTGSEIEEYENVGFVMSGSRHQRMNAVRLRKENQVLTAEEKHKLSLENQAEKQRREEKLLNEFSSILDEKEVERQRKHKRS